MRRNKKEELRRKKERRNEKEERKTKEEMRRKKEKSKEGQINNKAKQHSTPKAVTFSKKNELSGITWWDGMACTGDKI